MTIEKSYTPDYQGRFRLESLKQETMQIKTSYYSTRVAIEESIEQEIIPIHGKLV